MGQFYNIAGLSVKMDCTGRCLKQALAYSSYPSSCVDIEIFPDDVDRLFKKKKCQYPAESDDDLLYICFEVLFYSALTLHNGFMLHSSAVVVDGKAYLFSADPGTGKSTHTQLWLDLFGDRAYILNDDKPALRLVDGVWYAYGTPWSGKHDISVNARVPLGGIAVLERGNVNEISQCEPIDVVDTLINQVLLTHRADRVGSNLDNLDKLLNMVPVYRLKCNMDPEAAIISYEAMSGEKFIPNK